MSASEIADGVRMIRGMPAPSRWPPDRWKDYRADAARFDEDHSKEAEAAGWTAMDLFRVSKSEPWAVHAMGAVAFIKRRDIVEITDKHIITESRPGIRQRISKRAILKGTSLIWEI